MSIAKCIDVFKKEVSDKELDLFYQRAEVYQNAPKNFSVEESYKAAAYDIVSELEAQRDSVLKQVEAGREVYKKK